MKTCLYERHLRSGAKMVDFFGWELPIQYRGIIQEHFCVRSHVGIFDVSHMGRIDIKGKEAEKFLDYLGTNKVVGRRDGSAIYTVFSSENGFAVDDLIIYKVHQDEFFLVVNAANREKDLHHIKQLSHSFDVSISDHFEQGAILALQGPNSKKLLSDFFKEICDLKPMQFIKCSYHGEVVYVSRTGYTGSLGFELISSQNLITHLWDALLENGEKFAIQPIGLGARDSLRLEMGYALYGHELSDSIATNESVSAWTVKWEKPDFLGKVALEKIENSPAKRFQFGAILLDKRIAREGHKVFKNGRAIGYVTSGTHSPCLNQPIAIVFVDCPLQEQEEVFIEIRGVHIKAKIVSLPFFSPDA